MSVPCVGTIIRMLRIVVTVIDIRQLLLEMTHLMSVIAGNTHSYICTTGAANLAKKRANKYLNRA